METVVGVCDGQTAYCGLHQFTAGAIRERICNRTCAALRQVAVGIEYIVGVAMMPQAVLGVVGVCFNWATAQLASQAVAVGIVGILLHRRAVTHDLAQVTIKVVSVT